MLHSAIIFDVTRLVTRLGRLTPNGIDRIDLAYARYLAASPLDVMVGTMGPDGRARVGPRQALVEIVSAISDAWDEDGDGLSVAPTTPVQRQRRAFADERRHGQRRTGGVFAFGRLMAGWARLQRAGALVGPNGIWPGRSLATGAPQRAIYLNVSQFPIWRQGYLAALDQRPDVGCYFLLHDLLPVRYPEFFRPFEVRRHLGRLETIAQRAAGVIVSSEFNRHDLLAYCRDRSVRAPDIIVAPLPIEPAFRLEDTGGEAGAAARPFFICVGTIEPRKNHLFLLQVWRELIAQLGEQAPDLILVGSKGWQHENVQDLLERCPSLQGRVRLVTGLSTPALVQLMRGAKALLMPTFAEGYGLPVAEALLCGVPVIASDIEAFRQIDGPELTRLDPTDGLGWLRAIVEHLPSKMPVCRTPVHSAAPSMCHPCNVGSVIDQIAAR